MTGFYWDGTERVSYRIPRRSVERDMEDSLHRWYCDQPNILSVRRQYRWPGTQERADLLVWAGLPSGERCVTVVEVKAQAANLVTVRQVLRYMSHLKRNIDPETTVHATIAAPRFTQDLEAWLEATDPRRSTFALLEWSV